MGRGATVAAVVFFCAIACGCNDGGPFKDLEPASSFPGEPDDPERYEHLFAFEERPDCEPPKHPPVDRRAELRLFRGKVGKTPFRRHLAGLQRYWSWFEVDFRTRHPVIRVPLSSVLTIKEKAVRQRVKKKTGLDPSDALTADERERVRQATAQAVFHNFLELIRVYGVPRRDVVNVVVVSTIVDKEKKLEEMFGGSVLGLGVSPRLLRDIEQDAAELLALLREADIPEQFTPIAIVGADTVDRYLEVPDLALAHEAGHAYGLPHNDISGNLMNNGTRLCGATLEDEQLATVERSLDAMALEKAGPRILSLHRVLPELVDRLYRQLRQPPAGSP